MRVCSYSGKPFEETLENSLWRQMKQMQPMWLCLRWHLKTHTQENDNKETKGLPISCNQLPVDMNWLEFIFAITLIC